MPDPRVVVTGGSSGVEGKIEFFNDDGSEIGSLEPENTSGDSSTDEVKAEGLKINGGSYST
jgi:Ni,Fe-hydrogenase III small subunit|tara:strand:- start:389 stop:571 length:183 start_codon:yes stop_codon:yes gene_type:complete